MFCPGLAVPTRVWVGWVEGPVVLEVVLKRVMELGALLDEVAAWATGINWARFSRPVVRKVTNKLNVTILVVVREWFFLVGAILCFPQSRPLNLAPMLICQSPLFKNTIVLRSTGMNLEYE